MLRQPWPIARLLVLFVVVLALPLVGLIAWEGFQIASEEEHDLTERTVAMAERVSSEVDQMLQSDITLLKTLVTSPALLANDLPGFYRQARTALGSSRLYLSVSDPDGRELFHTMLPYGAPLPPSSGIGAVLADNRAFVSDYTFCPVAHAPVVMISLPFMQEGKLRYLISLSMEVSTFKELLDQQNLPSPWKAGIIDRNGVIIARSQRNAEFAGKPIPSSELQHLDDPTGRVPDLEGYMDIIARKRSKVAGWTVVVLVPEQVADAKVNAALLRFGTVVGFVAALGFAGAMYLGRIIVAPLGELRKAARAIGRGEEVSFTPSALKEAQEVGDALLLSAAQCREAESRLLEANERFMAAEEGVGGFVYDWDAVRDSGWRSPGFSRMLGWEANEKPVSLAAWRQLIHPDDRDYFDRAAATPAGGSMEYRVRHRDGHYVWIWDRGKFFWNEQGTLVRKVGSIIDITQRKNMEEQQALLLKELSHRSRNLLAVIQAVARQTLAACSSTAEAREALSHRLESLARTYETLTQTAYYNAPIAKIVGDELSAFSSRVEISGPPLYLNPGAAQTIALIIHELATNAAKYGALSVPDGIVKVQWRLEANSDSQFHFFWHERGGPAAKAPVRRGFGTMLTERIAAMQFGGEVAREFAPEGLSYRLSAPVKSVVAEPKHPFQRP